MINRALDYTSVTVVFIGYETASRRYVDYEIEQSIKRGNGILGVRIHHLKSRDGKTDLPGLIPTRLLLGPYGVHTYVDTQTLALQIEAAAIAAGR